MAVIQAKRKEGRQASPPPIRKGPVGDPKSTSGELKPAEISTSTNLGKGLLSIKEMMQGAKNERAVKEKDATEDYSNRPKDTFDQVKLMEVWMKYIKLVRKQNKSSFVTLLQTCEPQIEGEFKIVVKLDNSVQESELNLEKIDLLGFLRPELNNWSIQLESQLRKKEERVRYYTNRERYDRMVELNPMVAELKKRLNFDPDY